VSTTADKVSSVRVGGRLERGTLVAACLSVALAQLCLTLPVALNGEIQQTFRTSAAQLAWVTTAFVLPTAVLELNFGVVGDLFGRRRLLVGGAAFIAIGELVNALAGSVQALWAGQVIAGLGAAALFPASLAVIASATPSAASPARARGLAGWSLSLSVAAAIGPLTAGLIGGSANFHLTFVVPVVLGVVMVVVNRVLVVDSRAPAGRGLDWPGQISLALAAFAIIWAVQQASSYGWGSSSVVAGFVIGGLALAWFVVAELRSPSPMLQLKLLRIPRFAAAMLVTLIGIFSFVSGMYSISIRMSTVQFQSALRVAYPSILLQLVPLLLAPVLSRLLRRADPRWLLAGGLIPMGAGQLWLAAIPLSDTSLVAVSGPAVLIGIGFILMVSSFTAAAVNSVPPSLAGMASASSSLVRDFPQALGPAIMTSIAVSVATRSLGRMAAHGGPFALLYAKNATAHAAMESLWHGLSVDLVICAVAAFLAAVTALFMLRPRRC
jgi:MFS family permease